MRQAAPGQMQTFVHCAKPWYVPDYVTKLMASLIYGTGLLGLLHNPFVERQNSMEQVENKLPKNHKP